MPQIDDHLLSILKQFDRPGPRYTSYPTAPLFSADYKTENFKKDLTGNNQNNSDPLSLYLHIPFCDSLCYFCGCNTIAAANRDKIPEYISALKKEIGHAASFISKERKVVQLAWGGGSPSFLDPGEIYELSDYIRQQFNISDDAEISVELDPRDTDFDRLKAFTEGGANRFSIGVQDFNEDVQKTVNRVQPEGLINNVFDWCRKLGIKSINADLIYGLPLQTVENFKITLEKIIKLSPERIAAFNFAYVPWMKPHQKLIYQGQLPSAEEKLRVLQLTVNMLQDAGYVYIGMDHFAKPEDKLAQAQKNRSLHRNFQGYSARAGADLLGFGLSAISHFGKMYAQNAKELSEYYYGVNRGNFPVAVGYKMNRDDEIRKYVIMRIMCDLEVNKNEVDKKFGINFDEYFSEALSKLQEFIPNKLISLENDSILVNDTGRFVIRNIAMCFDAYLPKMGKEKQIFSRTV